MIGRPPFGCAAMGWLEMSKADAVMHAMARAAGIARPALLGLSRPNIRNPVFAALWQASSWLCAKLGRPAAGVNARPITLRGVWRKAKPADYGTSEAV